MKRNRNPIYISSLIEGRPRHALVAAFFILLTIAGISISRPALAADERPVVTLAPGYGTNRDTFTLAVTVSGKQGGQLGKPKLIGNDDFSIVSTGMSTRSEFINGTQSYQISFTFQLTPRAELPPGVYSLPEGSIEIDGKTVPFGETKVTILATPPLNSSQTGTYTKGVNGLDFTQVVDNEAPYVGQQILYRAEIATSIPVVRANLGDVTFEGFLRESYGKSQEQQRRIGDTVVHSVREGLFATKPGPLEIPARTLTAEVRIPGARNPARRRAWDMFDDIFQELDSLADLQTSTQRLSAPAIILKARELPPPPKPDLGNIPVGTLKVRSSVDLKELKQGESATLTIELLGDANLKSYELPAPARGDFTKFKTYNDKPQLEVSASGDRLMYKKTFKIALVPLTPGTLVVPQFEIASFDPVQGKYQFAPTTPAFLRVSGDGTAEKLVVKGERQSQPPAETEQKQEIQTLGEDLQPLHVGPELYRSSRSLSRNSLLITILAGPLLFMIGSAVSTRRRAFLADPGLIAQRHAAAKAYRSLKAVNQLPVETQTESAYLSFRQYLGERFRLPGETLTSADIESRLAKEIPAAELLRSISDLLAKFQRTVYGGAGANNSNAGSELAGEAQTLIERIEHDAR